jgi:hypothetical protein
LKSATRFEFEYLKQKQNRKLKKKKKKKRPYLCLGLIFFSQAHLTSPSAGPFPIHGSPAQCLFPPRLARSSR